MTLNLFVATPYGLWLSTDFRVTDRFRGTSTPRRDHWSPKYFEAITSEQQRLAITYTGVGEVVAVEPDFGIPDSDLRGVNKTPGKKRKVPVSEWMSWILHGQGRTLDETVHHIASEAAKVPELRANPHIFTGIAVAPADGAWVVQISNVDVRDGDIKEGRVDPECFRRRPLKEFSVLGKNVQTGAEAIGGGLGLGASFLGPDDAELLGRIARNRPKNHRDYMTVLAAINKRVASRDRFGSVSPACQVLYLDPGGPRSDKENYFDSQLYENGQKVPDDFDQGVFRANLFGIDITSLSRATFARFREERDDFYERKAQEYLEPEFPGS